MDAPRRRKAASWSGRGVIFRPVRDILALIVPDEPPLELQIVGRTLLHAALVGLVAGLVGSAFLWALEHVQALTLEDLCGYIPLRAAGEYRSKAEETGGPFRWYLLAFVPAIGGLVCGLLTRRAPEARGGGG
ncbi:MAG: hypothetical protein JO257_14240, partial [Deltaproteobacteria bacterium]|nr:hypothetical protein [Deltaproteobacteria bacterium]